MKNTKKHIHVDEAEVIELMRRSSERRLRELAGTYLEGPLEGGEGKVTDTVVSHGLKLTLKADRGSWNKGMLWVVTDPNKHPDGRQVSTTIDQLLLTHTDADGNIEDMVVLKNELDDAFELQ